MVYMHGFLCEILLFLSILESWERRGKTERCKERGTQNILLWKKWEIIGYAHESTHGRLGAVAHMSS